MKVTQPLRGAEHRQAVGWGHRGHCGSGTDGIGVIPRTAENTQEADEVAGDKENGKANEEIREERPEDKDASIKELCPPPSHRAGV